MKEVVIVTDHSLRPWQDHPWPQNIHEQKPVEHDDVEGVDEPKQQEDMKDNAPETHSS